MSELGDVLEAVNVAPRGFDVLLGELSTWRDMDVIRRGMERRGGSVVTATLSAEGGELPERPITRLWYARDGRFRVEQHGTVQVFDGDNRWMRHGDRLMQMPPPKGLIESVSEGYMLEPWWALGSVALEVADHARVAGHDGVVVEGRARADRHWGSPMVGFGFDWVRAHVDPRTGVLLRFESRFEGQTAVRTEFEAVEYDVPLAHDPFRMEIEPDERLWTQRDRNREMLERFGVDREGVDLDDDRAVMDAAMRSRGGPAGFAPPLGGPAHMTLAERVMPLGPLPDDLDAARAAVVQAIEGMSEVDDEGGLPNVQGGSNLGDALAQAQQRVNGEQARYEVDDVVFVRDDEAVVAFRVIVSMISGGLAQTGRVVKIGDRWKVERGTVCHLLGMAGVQCPPPPDEP